MKSVFLLEIMHTFEGSKVNIVIFFSIPLSPTSSLALFFCSTEVCAVFFCVKTTFQKSPLRHWAQFLPL